MTSRKSGMTCRVWLREVFKRLVQVGVVEVSANELEAESLEIGSAFGDEAAVIVQPRPVAKSKLCC